MPDLFVMVAAVAVVTEFLKATLRRFGVEPTQAVKVVLAVIGSICVIVYFTIQTGTPFSLNLIWLLIQLIAASVFGYKIAMKFRAKKETK